MSSTAKDKLKAEKAYPGRMVKKPSGRNLMELAGFIHDDLQSTEIETYLRQAFRGHHRGQ
jgi:hypothetical protein